MKNITSLVFAGLLSLSGSAFATLLDYNIQGIGSGSLNGVSFSQAAFSIDMIGEPLMLKVHGFFTQLLFLFN